MRRFFLLAAGGPLIACAAAAQDAGDDTLLAEPVIVTAPGPVRTADELIGAASAVERGELVARLAGSLGDTLDAEPGVATTFFGQGASRPVLRGLGAERVQVLTNGLGVIDASAASPDHQVAADAIDAEKVEILRGPAALAYGGQAIGGVVNVIDGLIVEELPENAAAGDAFAAFNSVNEGSEFGGRAAFAAGPFVLTLSGSARDFDDYDIPGFAESSLQRALEEAEEEEHDEEAGEEHGHEDEEEVRDTQENSFLETESLAAGLSWVGDRAFFGVAVRQQTAEYGLPGHGHEHGEDEHGEEEEGEEHGEEEHGEEEESPFIDLEQTRVDLRGGYRFQDGLIRSVSAAVAIADYEHTEFEAPGEAGTVFENDGVEGRIELDYGEEANGGAFGVQVLDKDFSAAGEEAFISPTDTTSLGAFLYHAAEFASGYGLEGGGRIENVEVTNETGLGRQTFDLVSGSIGAHRHFEGGVFLGLQLSYTERAPTDVELFADGPHLATQQFEVGDPNLDRERGLHLEGAARWRGDVFSVGVNVFATEFSDFIFLAPGATVEDGELVTEADGLPVFVFSQDDATFVGGEIYGDARIEAGPFGADWVFDASLDLVEADLDGGGDAPLIPPLTFNAGATAAWGPLSLGASTTLAADQDDPGAGQLETDGYALLNLRAAYALHSLGLGEEGTQVFLEARNVTDEEIRYATSTLKDLAPAPGQNIRAGLRVAF